MFGREVGDTRLIGLDIDWAALITFPALNRGYLNPHCMDSLLFSMIGPSTLPHGILRCPPIFNLSIWVGKCEILTFLAPNFICLSRDSIHIYRVRKSTLGDLLIDI